MLTYTDLKPGTHIVFDGDPYVVLDYSFMRKQMRKPTVQVKIKNLINGKVVEHTFQPSDTILEADIDLKDVKFLYSNRDEYWFCDPNNPRDRFNLEESVIGTGVHFLKTNSVVPAEYFDGKIINVRMPIKVELVVAEAVSAVKGNTSQNAVKSVKLETGTSLNVPLFINQGDVVRINTDTGEYVERVSKSKE